MPDRDSFLAAIAANPADDLPRLVFADWLDENGDPARARFIRDQIALAKLRPGTDEYKALFRRTADTLRANLPGWIQSACDAFGQSSEWKPGKTNGPGLPIRLHAAGAENSLQHVEFARGFIDSAGVIIWDGCPPQAIDDLFRDHPVTRLTLPVFTDRERWERAATPRMRSVRSLSFMAQHDGTAEAVFASPVWEGVSHLTLVLPGVEGLLVQSPLARRLSALRVWLTTETLAALSEYPLDDRLQEFGANPVPPIPDNQDVTPDVRAMLSRPPELWSALSRVAFRGTLKRLDLTQCGMTDDGLAAFARGERWVRLQGLKLGGNRFTDGGWADYCRGWRTTPELTYLDARRNRLTDAAAVALARSGLVQTLRTIDLRGCRVGGKGAAALASAARGGPLTRLLLAGNPLRPTDAATVRKLLGERVDI